MADPYIGEIRHFGFPYAPANWSQCNGSKLTIRQFSNLFALLGTQFGGDGAQTFMLPNLAGRTIVGSGQGPGLTNRPMGAAFGQQAVTLQTSDLPPHVHTFQSFTGRDVARQSGPAAGAALGNASAGTPFTESEPDTAMNAQMTTATGGGSSHPNLQPTLGLNACIALLGIWPDFG